MKNYYSIITILAFLLTSSMSFGQKIYADYHFDGSGQDSSVNFNHLSSTGTGSAFNYNQGQTINPKDSSIRFNRGKRMQSKLILDNARWGGMSLVTWVKGNGTGIVSHGAIYAGSYSGGGLVIESDGRVSGYYDGSGSGRLYSTKKINDSKWHQIVFQTDGDTSFMYIDGKFEAKQPERMYRTINSNPLAKIDIGMPRNTFDGLSGYDIDRLIIYEDVLTQSQIDSLNTKSCNCVCRDTVVVRDTIKTTDTLRIKDTLRTTDTLTIRDTITIRDTVRIVDTLTVTDTIRVTDTIVIRDTIHLGARGEIQEVKLALYPNPSNKFLNIEGLTEYSELSIVDVSGREASGYYIHEENENSVLIEIEELNEGLYFVLIDNKYTIRFVKSE